jgi:hypothetical protein
MTDEGNRKAIDCMNIAPGMYLLQLLDRSGNVLALKKVSLE